MNLNKVNREMKTSNGDRGIRNDLVCEAAVQDLFNRGIRNDSDIFKRLTKCPNDNNGASFTAQQVFAALQQIRRQSFDDILATTQDDSTSTTTSTTSSTTLADPELTLLNTRMQQSNASLNDFTVRGLSPLLYACSTCDEDLGIAILNADGGKRGVNVNERHDYGYTPLMYALEGSMLELTNALVKAGAQLELFTVDLQLQKGSVQSGGRRALHFAARALGQVGTELVQLLLNAGANPQVTDLDGNTPFILACIRHGDPSVSPTSRALLMALEHVQQLPVDVPTQEWLSNKVKLDQASGNARVQILWEVPTVLREVVTLPQLFTQKECTYLQQEVVKYGSAHGWLSDRHRGYATTDIRSAKIHSVDRWVRETLSTRLFPLLAARYNFSLKSFHFRDLFFVKYEATGQNSVGVHRDGSVLSFNVLLNPASEFDGGGTWFDHTQRTHTIEMGDCLLHSGKLRHAGTAITRGKRFILVGFVDGGSVVKGLELHFTDTSS